MSRKTRRANKNLLPRHVSTSAGIHGWYRRMMSQLGWMVIAHAKGMKDRMVMYKHSMKDLLATIDHVSAEYESANRKHDLNVIRMNTEVLLDYVNTHFS